MDLVRIVGRELSQDVLRAVIQHVLELGEEVLLWTAKGHIQIFLNILNASWIAPNADW
jgi:hypothetical protein